MAALPPSIGYNWRDHAIDLITIFPEFFRRAAGARDCAAGREKTGLVEVHVQDLREFTKGPPPHGGRSGRSAAAKGMVLKPEARCLRRWESLLGHDGWVTRRDRLRRILGRAVVFDVRGREKLFNQETARKFAGMDRLIFVLREITKALMNA